MPCAINGTAYSLSADYKITELHDYRCVKTVIAVIAVISNEQLVISN